MGSSRLLRAVVWLSEQRQGAERVVLWKTRDGYRVRSDWIGVDDGESIHAVYRLELDQTWLVRKLRVGWSAPAATTRLRVVRNAEGTWSVNGQQRLDLISCVDVDIAWSAMTNTLPIRRLGLQVGESYELSAAYIAPPNLTVVPDGQRYTRLTSDRWLYESLDGDFTAELTVDEGGLVIDYPPLFRRVVTSRSKPSA